MKSEQTTKLALALVLFAGAGLMVWRWWTNHREKAPQAWFYDDSKKELFVRPQDFVPPIAGLDGPLEDAYRAVVFSPSGNCDKDREIAYLEKYSPELKQQFERAKREPNTDFPRMPRALAPEHTFVRRLNATEWHALSSEEGGRIVGEWRLKATAGQDPAICIP